MVNIIIIFLCSFYVMSGLAVFVWDCISKALQLGSWIDPIEIFLPFYNTVLAVELWKNNNPFKSDKQ